jgi:hypothetical protein
MIYRQAVLWLLIALLITAGACGGKKGGTWDFVIQAEGEIVSGTETPPGSCTIALYDGQHNVELKKKPIESKFHVAVRVPVGRESFYLAVECQTHVERYTSDTYVLRDINILDPIRLGQIVLEE